MRLHEVYGRILIYKTLNGISLIMHIDRLFFVGLNIATYLPMMMNNFISFLF